ncbi:putative DNA directed RNA polymerase beta subunit [Erwinia phage vB_EamM_Simmy50]|uniref:DNA-directed RNA polymerase n=1 Tax=Erwinia phage vB_EamM_Simmy50 TaxID=1815988 RepID=A0A173GDE2_9CAUD|nr:RNA polymerase beta subunit [Erwinia phage vB_EamM_Simmy50]ANH51711.1 putative DNA directed RNA polymerase beta subunit [Erwinia phage vB_EamM_Simmy50]
MSHITEASELSAELLGSVLCLNPTVHGDSSPRSAMFGGHAGQAVTIEGSTPRMLKTGIEYEYGQRTFKIEAPCQMLVIGVINRFVTNHVGTGGVKENPEKYVIYQNLSVNTPTPTFGILCIPTYHTRNHALGFKYVMDKKAINRLYSVDGKAYIEKGVIFARSPNLTEGGDYKYGRETNVAFMSLPEVEQDGMVVTESFAQAMACTKIESRIAQWGDDQVLLNLYGDDENYKAFPDIGDKIREDGMLFAVRKIIPGTGIVNLTPKALRTYDPNFDYPQYAEAGATVVNVQVNSDRMRTGRTDVQFYDKQAERYERAAREFSKSLRKIYDDLYRTYGHGMILEPELNRMVTDAISDTGGMDRKMNNQGQIISVDKGTQVYNKVPIGDWRVKITFVKRIEAGVRFKITDTHGGKGVIVNVIPDADAPTDDYGNRADVIMDDVSITKRMNLGKPTEQYINGASVYAAKIARQMATSGDLDGAWNHLMSYYHAAAYEQWEMMQSPTYLDNKPNRDHHVRWVCDHGIELFAPTDRRYFGAEQVRRIMKEHDFPVTPVTYRAPDGRMVRTRDPVVIAPIYIILLEKMGEYWASCAIPKLTHFGTLSSLTQADKFALPWRNTPTRFGESELRLFLAACRGYYANRLQSMANTPAMQKEAALMFLRHDTPMNIPNVIDETKTPLGRARPLQMYKHNQGCRGIEFETTVLNK